MRLLVPVMLLLASLSSPVAAQETRGIPEDYAPPEASLAEFDWMIGQWEGPGVGGNRAVESWLAPTGDTMVGTFVQTDAEGLIQFSEHMYLMEEDGTVFLRLKHFNADLTGWEERDDMTSFRLISVEQCAAYFGGLTIRCEGDDGLLVAVRMRSSGGEISELLFDFERQREIAPNLCANEPTTIDMNECHAARRANASDRYDRYLAAALERVADNAELQAELRAADSAFQAYREAECGAVFTEWQEGTIRTVMTIDCDIALYDQRTHTVWENWLTYMDSTPADLPEPGPTP